MDQNEQLALTLWQDLSAMSSADRRAWFKKNYSSTDPKVLKTLGYNFSSDVMAASAEQPALSKLLFGTATPPKSMGSVGAGMVYDVRGLEATLDEKAAKAVAASGNGPISTDLDGNPGEPSVAEQRAIDKAKKAEAQKVADAQNLPADRAEQLVDDQVNAADVSGRVLVPQWLTTLNGGVRPDEGLVDVLIKKWNEYNPQAPVSDESGLYKAMQVPDNPAVKHVAESVFIGEDPIMDYRVQLSGGRSVTIQSDQFQAAQQHFQGDFNAKELTFFVRMADRIDMKDGAGGVAWQPLAALSKALFQGSAGYDSNKTYDQTATANSGFKPDGGSSTPLYQNNAVKLEQAALKYKMGLAQYGNTGLAYIAALDPALAAKLATTDYTKWDPTDTWRAGQLFSQGGWRVENSNLGDMGYVTSTDPTTLAGLLGNDKNGLGPNGSTATRQMPDPVAMRQAARDMYKSLYLADPTDAQLDKFVSSVTAQVSGAAKDQTVDPAARIRDLIEKDGAHRELYGVMPKGMTESEYQGQFRAAASSMLGQEAPDPNVVRSGMRQGEYQTTVGAAAGSKKAWGNSTFLGRLATAAQVVAQNT